MTWTRNWQKAAKRLSREFRDVATYQQILNKLREFDDEESVEAWLGRERTAAMREWLSSVPGAYRPKRPA